MTSKVDESAVDRVRKLLHHLGIEKAHFATGMASDLRGIITDYPELIASLTVDGPIDPRTEPLQSRILVITGDDGPRASNIARFCRIPARPRELHGGQREKKFVFRSIKTSRRAQSRFKIGRLVGPLGFEPRTDGLKVRCSAGLS